ncbi:MAG: ribosome maturation factor RimM [Candidatus Cryptobacteroides sp.]
MSGAESELLRIARVLKSNGTEGEVLVGFREIGPETLKTTEPVFIIFDGLPVPFFIDSFTRRGSVRALMRLTGVSNLNDAEEIVGRDLYAKPEAIAGYGEDGDELTLDDIVGWTVLDQSGHPAGTVSGYEDIPGNPCLYVETDNGQAMLPFHEDLILSVDEESGTIVMSIPEGLI